MRGYIPYSGAKFTFLKGLGGMLVAKLLNS